MNTEKIKSLNQQIWDQKEWGFHKTSKLLEGRTRKGIAISKMSTSEQLYVY